MHKYLEEAKFAAQSIINAYTNEFHELNGQIARFNEAGEWMRKFNEEHAGENLFEAAHQKDSFLATLRAMSKMTDQAREAARKAYELSDSIATHKIATQALCGSLLQIAKQGISTVHKGLPNCPDGRLIGSQGMKSIVWQGRNQTMHFEEGNLKQPVLDCFQKLDADFGTKLSAVVLTENLATNVIDVLGWHTYDAYEKDMCLLLP